MRVQEDSTLQWIMPPNETTISLGDIISVTDNLNLFFGAPAQVVDRFPLRLSAKCMLVVLKGDVTFRVNFRDCVAGDGTCAVFSPDTIVERVDIASDAHVIQFCYALENSPSVSGVFFLLPSQVELLKTAYNMLRNIMTDSAFAANREIAARKCIELLECVAQQGGKKSQETVTKPSRKDEIVAHFLQCVQENYREYRDLSFYAERLGLSLKYMSKVVYDQTGRHPSHWIKDHVILDAKAMLRSGQYSVQQVADELHFPNQSFFGKYFKEAVGVSPKKWR